eukprot:TRINITY_DN9747_c0_g1_i1.p1 TRINITY_DN9747_c0_g1~~TRINITY_DN9747_c0_g1_i1.p1  ORF type:complete len:980 (-),score=163.18 TRINITY_DN9747_c0_g1_i1:309-3248(-)
MPSRHDNYSFVKHLGNGGFATVELWRQNGYLTNLRSMPRFGLEVPHPDLAVAKRVYVGEMAEEEKTEARREVAVLKKLNHPFIVRYFESWINSSTEDLIIVQEYCEGGDLGRFVEERNKWKRPIDPAQVIRWLAQITHALQYCHKRICILHRDLKPRNIFLTREQTVTRLGDFGIAKQMTSSKSLCQTVVGTQVYMSPEVIRMQRYGLKCDVWSLGVTLYELCVLRRPFAASDPLAALQAIINPGGPAPFPPENGFPAELEALCMAMLEKDPEKRPTLTELLSSRPLLRDAVLQVEVEVSWQDSLVPPLRAQKPEEMAEMSSEDVAAIAPSVAPSRPCSADEPHATPLVEGSSFASVSASSPIQRPAVGCASPARPHLQDQLQQQTPAPLSPPLPPPGAPQRWEQVTPRKTIADTDRALRDAAQVCSLAELTVRRRELGDLVANLDHEKLPRQVSQQQRPATAFANAELSTAFRDRTPPPPSPLRPHTSHVSESSFKDAGVQDFHARLANMTVAELKNSTSQAGLSIGGCVEKFELSEGASLKMQRHMSSPLSRRRSDLGRHIAGDLASGRRLISETALAHIGHASEAQQNAATISARLKCVEVLQEEEPDPVELTRALKQVKALALTEEECGRALVVHTHRLRLKAEDVIAQEGVPLPVVERAAEVLEAAQHVPHADSAAGASKDALKQVHKQLQVAQAAQQRVGLRCTYAQAVRLLSVRRDAALQDVVAQVAKSWKMRADAFSLSWQQSQGFGGPAHVYALRADEQWQRCLAANPRGPIELVLQPQNPVCTRSLQGLLRGARQRVDSKGVQRSSSDGAVVRQKPAAVSTAAAKLEQMAHVFRQLDLCGSGEITRDDLKRALRPSWSDRKVIELLQAIDSNRDGRIHYEEFAVFFAARDDGWDHARRALLAAAEGMVAGARLPPSGSSSNAAVAPAQPMPLASIAAVGSGASACTGGGAVAGRAVLPLGLAGRSLLAR